jgi:hypothetical protein
MALVARSAEPAAAVTRDWCECDDAPRYARGAATLLDHPGACDFPDGICTERAHRVTVHPACGRELRIRFCGCGGTGFSHDVERDWWVHYECGWPTRAWYEAAGRPAPDHLAGLRPVTYHEFRVVPENPRAVYERLDPRQRELNRARAGSWVRD